MNSSQSNSPPPSLPTLSAPNKTLASNKPPRRQSTFSNSPTSSPLARSPTSPTTSLTRTLSSDLPDITTTLAQLSPPHLLQQQQPSAATTIKQTIASTTSSFLRRPSSESLFNPTQTAALKTLASSIPLNSNDSSFWPALLKTSKLPSTHST